MASIANQVMPPPIHDDRVWKQDGNTGDIVEAILSAEQWNQSQTAALAPHLKGGSTSETLRNVWFFVRNYVKYKKDAAGYERVKLPAKTWADGYGDCKSMSVFIAGLLKNLGIPAKYRFVSYRRGEPFTHVYVVATPKGERPVVLDAVHSKFDTEENYTSKKDYPIMTKIAVVHGLPGSQGNDDKPRKLAPWQKIFWGKLTEGEMRLALIGQQIDIVKDWYGDPTGQLAKSVTAIQNTLYRGVHGIGTGSIPVNILPEVAGAIRSARWQMKPAGSHFTSMRNPRKEGLIPDYIGLPDKEFEQVMKDYLGTGECAAPLEYPVQLDQYGYEEPAPGYGQNAAMRNIPAFGKSKGLTKGQETQLLNACAEQNQLVELYNNKLKKGAHHLLYTFITNSNVATNDVATKSVLHKISRDVFGPQISGLSKENMNLFLRNGIMYTNGESGKGLDPLTPEETIKMMIAGNQEAVGELGLVAIVGLIVALLGAAVEVISAIKGKVPPKNQAALNQIEGLGTPSFGAETSDWTGYRPSSVIGPNGQPILQNDPTASKAGMNWILPVLIGGGLLLGAKSMK